MIMRWELYRVRMGWMRNGHRILDGNHGGADYAETEDNIKICLVK